MDRVEDRSGASARARASVRARARARSRFWILVSLLANHDCLSF